VKDDVTIIPKPENISWESITDLLHLSFRERANEGLIYGAFNQQVEKTKKRVEDGICLVALLNGELIGTGTVKFYQKKGKRFGHLSQVAVHPDYKKHGIGTRLREYRVDLCRKQQDIDAVYCDTAEQATPIINWYLKAGWQKVGYLSHLGTNYYSVKFRLPINGRKYSKLEALLRYYFSIIAFKLMKTKHGEWTAIGSMVKKTLRK